MINPLLKLFEWLYDLVQERALLILLLLVILFATLSCTTYSCTADTNCTRELSKTSKTIIRNIITQGASR